MLDRLSMRLPWYVGCETQRVAHRSNDGPRAQMRFAHPTQLLFLHNSFHSRVVKNTKLILTLMPSGQKLATRFFQPIHSKEIDMPVTTQEVYTR